MAKDYYCKNQYGQKFTVQQVQDFMNDPQNYRNCEECPDNAGIESSGYTVGGCGQQSCWVHCHTEAN